MTAVPRLPQDQPGPAELRALLRRGVLGRGLALVGAGLASVAACVLLSFVFTAVLPAEARLWGTLAFAALGLGFLLLGGVTLLYARLSQGGSR